MDDASGGSFPSTLNSTRHARHGFIAEEDSEPQEWPSRGFIEEGRVFSETFPVRYDETGPNKRATMTTVASMIQECACNHVQALWGRAQSTPRVMREGSLAFVQTRLHVIMHEYPKWGDQVEVKTWLDVPGKATARRDYELVLCDAPEGVCKSLGAATSRWVAFNVETRKMARMPALVIEQVSQCALPSCHALGAGYKAGKLPNIRDVSGLSRPITHSVRRSDMDMNGHVNNVVYAEWILETVPPKMYAAFELCEMEIEFLNECNYGDMVDAVCCREVTGEGVVVEEDEVSMVHMLLKHGVDGRDAEVVRARTSWKRKGFMPAEEKEMAKIIEHAWQKTGNQTGGWARKKGANVAELAR